MNNNSIIILVLLCACITVSLRALPLIILANKRMSIFLTNWLSFIPSTIMFSIVVVDIMSRISVTSDTLQTITATIITGLTAFLSRSLFMTVFIGVASYVLISYL
ncbi:AzlD domain-containing protein [Salmonella enterica]|uniref:AzlD domain-containing protein n=2 Tax=Salmonella enterica TaxID=28901 RepID=A0A7U7L9Q8_SALER|nr:AzlD domain-containing protein [Salmonella enterica]PTU40362.1 branched-chain amino acid ABC transporter [Salmonella enterica subsp. enterica]